MSIDQGSPRGLVLAYTGIIVTIGLIAATFAIPLELATHENQIGCSRLIQRGKRPNLHTSEGAMAAAPVNIAGREGEK
ncbi:hypothetical protein [Rhizobium bangladeshense]|uniref:hypothetical protein n=1 Tax=Rhizobium bangladeshense TaxID=1138189 RepID=UPI0007E5788D|nr:hypothetical protein [Rhizobium bangladeshense]